MRFECTTLLALGLALSCNKPDQRVAVSAQAPSVAVHSSPADALAFAPDVTFTLSDGFRLSLAALRGKVIAVMFCSAMDSPGCAREWRGLGTHWSELEKNYVTAIGVVPNDTAQLRAAIARHDAHFEFAVDPARGIARAFGMSARDATDPTLFIVARDGSIRSVTHVSDPEAHTRLLLEAAR